LIKDWKVRKKGRPLTGTPLEKDGKGAGFGKFTYSEKKIEIDEKGNEVRASYLGGKNRNGVGLLRGGAPSSSAETFTFERNKRRVIE